MTARTSMCSEASSQQASNQQTGLKMAACVSCCCSHTVGAAPSQHCMGLLARQNTSSLEILDVCRCRMSGLAQMSWLMACWDGRCKVWASRSPRPGHICKPKTHCRSNRWVPLVQANHCRPVQCSLRDSCLLPAPVMACVLVAYTPPAKHLDMLKVSQQHGGSTRCVASTIWECRHLLSTEHSCDPASCAGSFGRSRRRLLRATDVHQLNRKVRIGSIRMNLILLGSATSTVAAYGTELKAYGCPL